MENLVWLIPVLACPLMMLAMMWMMGKGMGSKSGEPEAQRSVDELRAEQRRLATEIERLEPRDGTEPADAGQSVGGPEYARRSD